MIFATLARFIEAKGKGIFTREQLQELDSLGVADVAPQHADELMQEADEHALQVLHFEVVG